MAFGGFLKQSTAVDVLLGPFVDEDDGKTAENALVISQGDVLLSKNGQALTQKSDATACAFDSSGYYNCELDATDTNTLGILTVIVHESGALPVRLDFEVLSSANYTSFVETNMTTVSKNWAAAVVLVSTPAFGGTDSVLAADQAYDYSGDVDLETSGHQGAQVLIETKLNFNVARTLGAPSTPSTIIVDVFASLNGSTYDTIPYLHYEVKGRGDSDWRRFSFVVQELAHFRIGVKTDGGADTYDYRITHQRWNTDDS
jgi:hypothetical protein